MANLGIKIAGPVQSIGCFGTLTREISSALLSMGETVSIVDTTTQGDFLAQLSEDDVAKFNMLKQTNIPAPFVIIHVNAPEKITFIDNTALANIAWTSSDVLTLPLISSLMLSNNAISEIWVPSSQKMAFDNYEYLSKKTSVQNFGVNTDKFNPSLTKDAKASASFRSPDAFHFGFIGSLKYTSGFDIVLKAFFEEFSDSPNVKLVLKTFMGTLGIQQEKELIGKIIKDFKRDSKAEVLYIPGNQNDAFMTELHHSIDCLVSPARGKAWNNSVIKCMAAGIPTIANTHAGNKSYTGKETNYLLGSSKNLPIRNLDWLSQSLLHQGSDWSEPNVDEVKKTMRLVYNNREQLSDVATKARTRVEKLEWKNVAMDIVKNIKKFS